jgi:hypothetical protein
MTLLSWIFNDISLLFISFYFRAVLTEVDIAATKALIALNDHLYGGLSTIPALATLPSLLPLIVAAGDDAFDLLVAASALVTFVCVYFVTAFDS